MRRNVKIRTEIDKLGSERKIQMIIEKKSWCLEKQTKLKSSSSKYLKWANTQMNKTRGGKWDIMRDTAQFHWIIVGYFKNLYNHKLIDI